MRAKGSGSEQHTVHANSKKHTKNTYSVQRIIQIKANERTNGKKNPHRKRKHGDGTHKSIATNNIIYMAELSAAMQRNSHELGTAKKRYEKNASDGYSTTVDVTLLLPLLIIHLKICNDLFCQLLLLAEHAWSTLFDVFECS